MFGITISIIQFIFGILLSLAGYFDSNLSKNRRKLLYSSFAVILISTGIINIYLSSHDIDTIIHKTNQTLNKVNDLSTRIDWENSPLTIHIMDFNNSKVIAERNKVTARLMIIPNNGKSIPKTINILTTLKKSTPQHLWGANFNTLNENDAIAIYLSQFDKNLQFFYDDEMAKGVTLFYYQETNRKEILKDFFDRNLNLAFEPLGLNIYPSLSTLNNTFIILAVTSDYPILFGDLSIVLNTPSGKVVIGDGFKNIRAIKTPTRVRFIGFYIPENTF